MRNYQIYFVLMGLSALIALCVLFQAVSTKNSEWFMGILIVQVPLGIIQLLTGLTLMSRFISYPTWAQKGITNYWRFSVIYLMLIFINFFLEIPLLGSVEVTWLIFLILIPWSIASYQFQLLYRMAALRKRQLQKRELLQLS